MPPFEQVLGLFVCGVAGAGAGAALKLALDLEALRASTQCTLHAQHAELEALRASTRAEAMRASLELEPVLQAGSKVHSMHRTVEGLRAECEADRDRIQRCERDTRDALRALAECKMQQARWGSEVSEALDVSHRSASETALHRDNTQAMVRKAIHESRASMKAVLEDMQQCMDETDRYRRQVVDMMAYTQTMQQDNEAMKGDLVGIANKLLHSMGPPELPSSSYKLLHQGVRESGPPSD